MDSGDSCHQRTCVPGRIITASTLGEAAPCRAPSDEHRGKARAGGAGRDRARPAPLAIGPERLRALNRVDGVITRIIGIDCATDARKVGIATFDRGGGAPLEVLLPGRGGSPHQIVANLLESEYRTLIALDAPLGWPSGLARALASHTAGKPINVPSNLLFRRLTDRFVKDRLGKQPLDVGADRIARTAHAALGLLGGVSADPIGLAWSPDFEARVAAIEVYPAATLVAYGLPSTRYKRPDQRDARTRIAAGLEERLPLPPERGTLLDSADALDAAVCVLAAIDFLDGRAYEPPEPEVARREGWIWVAERAGGGAT